MDESSYEVFDHPITGDLLPRFGGENDAELVLNRHAPLDSSQAIDSEVVHKACLRAELARVDAECLGRERLQAPRHVVRLRHAISLRQ